MACRLLAFAASLALLSLFIPSALSGNSNTIKFHVEEGSNNIYFAVNIFYSGQIKAVQLKETNSPYPGANGWETMTHSWANIWRLDPNHPTLPPFSIMITDSKNNRFVAKNVIPPNWKNNAVYTANLVRA